MEQASLFDLLVMIKRIVTRLIESGIFNCM